MSSLKRPPYDPFRHRRVCALALGPLTHSLSKWQMAIVQCDADECSNWMVPKKALARCPARVDMCFPRQWSVFGRSNNDHRKLLKLLFALGSRVSLGLGNRRRVASQMSKVHSLAPMNRVLTLTVHSAQCALLGQVQPGPLLGPRSAKYSNGICLAHGCQQSQLGSVVNGLLVRLHSSRLS